jgi:two-component system, OmpR family, sensor kinase
MMSLRTRLLAAVGTIAILALGVASVATYSLLQSYLYGRADQSLRVAASGIAFAADSGQELSSCIGPGRSEPPSRHNQQAGPRIPGGLPELGSILTVSYEVRLANGAVANGQHCAAYVGGRTYEPAIPHVIAGLTRSSPVSFTTGSTKPGGPHFRVRASILANGSTLLVGIPLTDADSTLHKLLLIELIVSAIALLFAISSGIFLVRLGLRPLDAVGRTAASIAEGDLSVRISGVSQRTEVGKLSNTLNRMLDQIEGAFGARDLIVVELRKRDELLRQFLSDASHELRTPIAAIAAYAELVDHWGPGDPVQLSRALTGIRAQSLRMEQLVDDLLTLARLDEGVPLEQVRVELVSCCTEVIATAEMVGPGWTVDFKATESVEVIGSPAQLHRMVENLVANVRAHTPRGTATTIRVSKEGGFAVITVTDVGQGMSVETMAHAFDRFYRSDPGRNRSHGGSGLGLSIVAGIVAAHGGTVGLSPTSPTGTTVTIRLPLAEELTE